MKALFFIFNGLDKHSGISKKILSQVAALKNTGVNTSLCHLEINAAGEHCRMIDDNILTNYGIGIGAKIKKRINFNSVVDHVENEKYDFVYIRCDFNASPVTISFVKKLKRTGAKLIMEIPTYPYDKEFDFKDLYNTVTLLFDKLYRHKFAKYLDFIVTFSDYDKIFDIPALKISNGVDFDAIPVKSNVHEKSSGKINLISVSEVHFWHGIDRVITGMGDYYKKRALGDENDKYKKKYPDIYFYIVGKGFGQEFYDLKKLALKWGLEDKIFFCGNMYGEKLDNLFNECDFGIGSLARHRSGITKIKTIKNREYAARGIPFVYSECDDDFDDMPYVLKAPADESPLDMERIADFYENMKLTPDEIRKSISGTLSWNVQMGKVVCKANDVING